MTELSAQLNQLMKQQLWTEAIRLAKENSEILQSSFDASWTTGWAYVKLENYLEAVPHLERACSIAPVSCSHIAYWALGVVWMELERYELAEQCLLKALEIKSGHLGISVLALVYLRTGRINDAERVHLEGLDEIRTQQRLESYADFLGDTGRVEEEAVILLEAQNAQKEGKKYTSS